MTFLTTQGTPVVRHLPGGRPDPAVLRRLKAGVRDQLRLPEDAVVIVSELRCGDRGCSPVETLVAVLDAGGRRVWRLPHPVDGVSLAGLRDLLAARPDGGRE